SARGCRARARENGRAHEPAPPARAEPARGRGAAALGRRRCRFAGGHRDQKARTRRALQRPVSRRAGGGARSAPSRRIPRGLPYGEPRAALGHRGLRRPSRQRRRRAVRSPHGPGAPADLPWKRRAMALPHELAGKPAPAELLIDPELLVEQYRTWVPDPGISEQRVQFGPRGHRGSPQARAFNEAHILAMTQAICEYRAAQGIRGPLFLGRDTHGASDPAERTALEVLAANGVETVIDEGSAFTPTPVISRAILRHNAEAARARADGIVVTPSHNPPGDGGFKYNPPTGGPAESEVTRWIQDRANRLLEGGCRDVRRIPYDRAAAASTTYRRDLLGAYVEELATALDLDAVANAGLALGVDPLGGASVEYWPRIAERFGVKLTVVNPVVDARFAFMPLDRDGKI